MRQKVNPVSFRVGNTKPWKSVWVAPNKKDYIKYLHEDIEIRKYIKKSFGHGYISEIIIERPIKSKIIISLHVAKLKIKSDIEKIKAGLVKITESEIIINILEIKKPDTNAQLIAESIAQAIVKRASYKKALKRALQTAMKQGTEGIRVQCAGRLGGAEIARTEFYRQGRIPLQTLKANIEYGFAEALTTYGIIGIAVLVYHGDIKKENKY